MGLPLDLLHEFEVTPRELALLISGSANLDPGEWRENCKVQNYDDTEAGQVIAWFWEVVQEMSDEERSRLLHFITGSSRLPLSGFEGFRPPIELVVGVGEVENLPTAHTCANQLTLPLYEEKEQLESKLKLAIRTEGFAFL